VWDGVRSVCSVYCGVTGAGEACISGLFGGEAFVEEALVEGPFLLAKMDALCVLQEHGKRNQVLDAPILSLKGWVVDLRSNRCEISG
jgi:hypothetical protein